MSKHQFSLLVGALLTVACAVGALEPREQMNFDFAWRFQNSDVDPSQYPSCAQAFDPGDVYCNGRASSATTAEECQAQCCLSPMCRSWVFSTKAGGCILDHETRMPTCRNKTSPSEDWVGRKRSAPAPLPPLSASDKEKTSREYDDSGWTGVDVPHDALIGEPYRQNFTDPGHAYIPYKVTWYRKHFNIPDDWEGSAIWIYFEGVFRAASVFLNGKMLTYHDSGYTSFTVNLSDNGVLYGTGKEQENVIAVRSQGFGNSGHWYEGGGIYRHVYLIRAGKVHFDSDGILGAFVFPGENQKGGKRTLVHFHKEHSYVNGQFVDEASLNVRAIVVNDHSSKEGPVNVSCVFTLYDRDHATVAGVSTDEVSIGPKGQAELVAEVSFDNVELWSPARPYNYMLSASLLINRNETMVMDKINGTSVGARMTSWSPDDGFHLNGEPFKWRGFNDHNDFGGVGAAVPERINLYRSLSIRAVGGNARRMSHNPPVPSLLDILDTVGVLVWNENRNFGPYEQWADDMADLVKRDRNHPSVMIWSFCNEGGCGTGDDAAVGGVFRAVSKNLDPFRPVSANMVAGKPSALGNALSDIIDVQGFSHMQGVIFDSFHEMYPTQPVINSECCSCVTQRGEDVPNPKEAILGNFNAECISEQTSRGLLRKFVVGSMVWTLFDYYGEPTPYHWPMISCSFGSIDLAGFSKAAAFWYRAWWLYNTTNASSSPADIPRHAPLLLDPEKPSEEQQTKDNNGFLVHIVQHWEPDDSQPLRTINVYSNAQEVRLSVNGKNVGSQMLDWLGWATWTNITFAAGMLTADAMSSDGHILASHIVKTAEAASALQAIVDVPSEQTSTGSALLADGQDAALVRVMVVDKQGTVVPSSDHNITFKILSGPGRVIGVANGNPSCHEPNQVSWRSAYHGLARAVVQVTVMATGSPEQRQRMLQIDADAGLRTGIAAPGEEKVDDIVVEASSPGLSSATVHIQVSKDADMHSVMAVARQWAMSAE